MPTLFELSDIHFAYPGRPPALAGASLTVTAGERLALTGANGAGKSTLLQIMVGLLTPSAGHVVAFDQPRRREADFHEVRRRAGLVFQDPDDQLFCPTVAEDVAFGPLNLGMDRAAAEHRVRETLDQLGLSTFRDRITHQLSGGEKRLVSLAAVLAMKPDVLLLDEPSNGLDEPTTEHLVTILDNLPQTLILVSHDPHFRTRLATRTLTLTHGQLTPTPNRPRRGSHEQRGAAPLNPAGEAGGLPRPHHESKP
ncbi:energy-coupling factor ABC transporter ATP-binding protein [Roseospirillum parvum]|uniref:Cobalt/nickel transport system ATP-binding protein n=1 Tax=Roseospirillum parvum TaxID=83401 RepID=A0A1G7VCQ8_9PROT|nr:ABC transporter ATP-binding protein [Roseospirillum parvum]SDG57338.1 cobalt/nickel transport system ATP-binding protein [Roseospirillum parvum]